MESAVSTVLAGNQLTAWDVFGDCRSLADSKPSWRTASQAAGGPHSRRNLWQPQVTGFRNLTAPHNLAGLKKRPTSPLRPAERQ